MHQEVPQSQRDIWFNEFKVNNLHNIYEFELKGIIGLFEMSNY